MQPHVLIVEDSQPVRKSIREWLGINFPDCLFHEAGSGEEALQLAVRDAPHLVLMDIELPGMNGLTATRKIKELCPRTEVLILTIHEDIRYQDEATAAGAGSFLPKREMYKRLVPMMEIILAKVKAN